MFLDYLVYQLGLFTPLFHVEYISQENKGALCEHMQKTPWKTVVVHSKGQGKRVILFHFFSLPPALKP